LFGEGPTVLLDRHGRKTLQVDGVRLFAKRSDGALASDFRAQVRNISDAPLALITLEVSIRTPNGNTYSFEVPNVCYRFPCENGSTHEAWRAFLSPYPYTADGISSVDIAIKSGVRLVRGRGLTATGLFANDPGCLKDYRAARLMTGVALRKKLAEIAEYGCGVFLDKPTHVTLDGKITEAGAPVSFVDDGFVLGFGPSTLAFRRGWVVPSLLANSEVLLQEDIGLQQ